MIGVKGFMMAMPKMDPRASFIKFYCLRQGNWKRDSCDLFALQPPLCSSGYVKYEVQAPYIHRPPNSRSLGSDLLLAGLGQRAPCIHMPPKWRHNPCLLGVPNMGRNQHSHVTPAVSNHHSKGNQYVYVTLAFSLFPLWGENNMVPTVGRNQYGYMAPGLLGVPMVGRVPYGYITPYRLDRAHLG